MHLSGGGGGGVSRFSTLPPEKLKTIFHQAVSHSKKMNITKLNQLHLANELAIHNFKHQNFKDTQTLNFGQAKNENKNKHNHYYGRQPHNLDKKRHAIICMLTKYWPCVRHKMFQKYILQKRFPSKHGAMISRYTVHVHNKKPYTKNKPQMNRNSIKFFQFA